MLNQSPGRKSFARILRIHQWICRRQFPSGPELARRLEVSIRTVERDIDALRCQFNAPVEYDSLRKGYYYERPFELPPVQLAEGEALALVMGERLLAQYGGTPFVAMVQSAMDKLLAVLPETVSIESEELAREISFDIEPTRGDQLHLIELHSVIATAIKSRETLNVAYYTASRDELTHRSIDPYHLRYYRGAWYVIAYCHLRNRVRVFALDRIRECQPTGEHFTPHGGFSPEEFLRDSFGIEIGQTPHQVIIRFDAEQARFIRERTWHPSQEIQDQPDGSLILKLRVSGLGEVKRWLLGFGSHAEVLSPPDLRSDLAAETQAMAGVYGRGVRE